jgi:hypothetical protein
LDVAAFLEGALLLWLEYLAQVATVGQAIETFIGLFEANEAAAQFSYRQFAAPIKAEKGGARFAPVAPRLSSSLASPRGARRLGNSSVTPYAL